MTAYLLHWRHPKHGSAACDKSGRIPYWALDSRISEVSCSRCKKVAKSLAAKQETK